MTPEEKAIIDKVCNEAAEYIQQLKAENLQLKERILVLEKEKSEAWLNSMISPTDLPH